MTESSTSTLSGVPSLPSTDTAAELVVSLTESSEQPKAQNQEDKQPKDQQQVEQLPILPQTPPQQQISTQQGTVATSVESPLQSAETSRLDISANQSPQQKNITPPHPLGTAFFDNIEVTPYHLMPQEVRSSLSGDDNSRDSDYADYVDTPEPIAENPILREMEEASNDPKFMPKYAYIVELSVDAKPKQKIIKVPLPKRFDTTILVTAGIISSALVLGLIFFVKTRKQ